MTASALRVRLTIKHGKRAEKAVTRIPTENPAEQSWTGRGIRTHVRTVVNTNKPTRGIGLAQTGKDRGWASPKPTQMHPRRNPAESGLLPPAQNGSSER